MIFAMFSKVNILYIQTTWFMHKLLHSGGATQSDVYPSEWCMSTLASIYNSGGRMTLPCYQTCCRVEWWPVTFARIIKTDRPELACKGQASVSSKLDLLQLLYSTLLFVNLLLVSDNL